MTVNDEGDNDDDENDGDKDEHEDNVTMTTEAKKMLISDHRLCIGVSVGITTIMKTIMKKTITTIMHRDLSLYLWYNPSNFEGSKTDFFQNDFFPVY